MAKGKNEAKYWLSLTGIAVQMGVIIYLGAKLGQWLDIKYQNEKNTYTIILTLVAVAISMYLVIQQTKKLNS
jgi:membrane protein DedA with SNARE-associated domain